MLFILFRDVPVTMSSTAIRHYQTMHTYIFFLHDLAANKIAFALRDKMTMNDMSQFHNMIHTRRAFFHVSS